IQKDIVAATELRVETRTQLQQCGDTPLHLQHAAGWLQNAADQLKQSGFARTVGTQYTNDLSARDRKGDIPQRPEITVKNTATTPKRLLQAIDRLVIEVVTLGQGN